MIVPREPSTGMEHWNNVIRTRWTGWSPDWGGWESLSGQSWSIVVPTRWQESLRFVFFTTQTRGHHLFVLDKNPLWGPDIWFVGRWIFFLGGRGSQGTDYYWVVFTGRHESPKSSSYVIYYILSSGEFDVVSCSGSFPDPYLFLYRWFYYNRIRKTRSENKKVVTKLWWVYRNHYIFWRGEINNSGLHRHSK